MTRSPVTSTEVERIDGSRRQQATDLVAVEEPLQILVEHGPAHARRETPLAMIMRTPGHDRDLVTGFLFAEGVISKAGDLITVRPCFGSDHPHNVVRAVLHDEAVVPKRLLERTLMVTSACGICGERTVEALSKQGCATLAASPRAFRARAVERALASLESSQTCFRHTGGTHGAALFDRSGSLLRHREDVGRHNALDKLVGAWLSEAIDPMQCFVVVSSRASFELVQKSVRAGFPMMVAIGAASSLAVETARRFGLTLLGFAKNDRFNVYSCGDRIGHDDGEIVFLESGAR